MNDVTFLYSTAPDENTANAIAEALVESGVAACVNIFSGMRSVYRWRGETETACEVAMIVKTTADAAGRARDIILQRHPYENPALAAIRIDETLSAPAFCGWIRENARQR